MLSRKLGNGLRDALKFGELSVLFVILSPSATLRIDSVEGCDDAEPSFE
jgi:hypothetical protein